MARILSPNEHLVEEEYIDMDVGTATFLCCSMSSPLRPTEFEFQKGCKSVESQPLTSPADELFYKGKLLPLYLPPRLQMVEKILQNTANSIHQGDHGNGGDDIRRSISVSTPFNSCVVSPATSCCVSRELDAEDYMKHCAMDELVQSNAKKSWSKKLKIIKQSAIGLKLKASKAYLKSFFTKSGCSKAKGEASKANDAPVLKVERKHLGSVDAEELIVGDLVHRKSFSCVLKRQPSTRYSSPSKSSSFTSENDKDQLCGQTATLRRSSSVNSDKECSIQGAIAYCKRSHEQVSAARRSASDVGLCLMSGSRVAPDSVKEDGARLCSR